MSDPFVSPLVDDLATFRRLGHLAVDVVADYLETLRERPVFVPMTPDERQELLTLDFSEEGIPPEELLATVRDRLFTHPMGNGHPAFSAGSIRLLPFLVFLLNSWRRPSIPVVPGEIMRPFIWSIASSAG
ncbi:hypothetical protein [Dictyobacter kobayashii]|uniref:Uncharacterized protein n=1 Tax=Dictyobacter kobayashii TaxID=2014872 RepID=A0A402ANS6_9CHLR|nr:hypothetical protein [Dictyobacter kobayashii]GCE20848.1 hypothetical protein KDK_46480 [Dictyobacter kobayashii]